MPLNYSWPKVTVAEGCGQDKVMEAEVSKKPRVCIESMSTVEFGLCLAFGILSRPDIIFVYPGILDNNARNPNLLGETAPGVIF